MKQNLLTIILIRDNGILYLMKQNLYTLILIRDNNIFYLMHLLNR